MLKAWPRTGKPSFVPQLAVVPEPSRGCPSALFATSCPSIPKGNAGGRASEKQKRQQAVKKVMLKHEDLGPGLRPSTAAELKNHNVIAPTADVAKNYQKVALLLAPQELAATTKTGHQDDSLLVNHVNADRAFVSSLVQELSQAAQRQHRLALLPNLTLAIYQKKIKESAKRLGYEKPRLTPRLMRHGGPSKDLPQRCLEAWPLVQPVERSPLRQTRSTPQGAGKYLGDSAGKGNKICSDSWEDSLTETCCILSPPARPGNLKALIKAVMGGKITAYGQIMANMGC